jgi:acetoin utilization deacetylase AcuC-like enzyme
VAGYCYLNSAAIAAKRLALDWSELDGKIAIIDIDYHCGNGTIGIFWDDPSVRAFKFYLVKN